MINTLNNTTTTEATSIHATTKGVYITKAKNEKTQFRTEFSALYQKNSSLLNWRDTISIYNPDSMDL